MPSCHASIVRPGRRAMPELVPGSAAPASLSSGSISFTSLPWESICRSGGVTFSVLAQLLLFDYISDGVLPKPQRILGAGLGLSHHRNSKAQSPGAIVRQHRDRPVIDSRSLPSAEFVTRARTSSVFPQPLTRSSRKEGAQQIPWRFGPVHIPQRDSTLRRAGTPGA